MESAKRKSFEDQHVQRPLKQAGFRFRQWANLLDDLGPEYHGLPRLSRGSVESGGRPIPCVKTKAANDDVVIAANFNLVVLDAFIAVAVSFASDICRVPFSSAR